MTRENAKKLQSMMAKEAVTLLMLGGAEADTERKESAADAFEPPAARTQGEVVCGGGAHRGRAGDGVRSFHGNGEFERVFGFRA